MIRDGDSSRVITGMNICGKNVTMNGRLIDHQVQIERMFRGIEAIEDYLRKVIIS